MANDDLDQARRGAGRDRACHGLWWLNACRIVYVVDEPGPIRTFGFAYGTLPGHVEKGEERFLIEWDKTTNAVSYDIRAFSPANRLLIRLGYPAVRRAEKRFGRHSAAAMFRAVNQSSPIPEIRQTTEGRRMARRSG